MHFVLSRTLIIFLTNIRKLVCIKIGPEANNISLNIIAQIIVGNKIKGH